MADFFLRHERISWVLVSGRLKDKLILSLRTNIKTIKQLKSLPKFTCFANTIGGHNQTAGNFIKISKTNRESLENLAEKLKVAFARVLGFEKAEWHELLD